MYFLGAEHLALAFAPMWNRIGEKYGNNHKVAAAFPNDSDGNAFRAVFPQVLKPMGYTLDLSTAYPDGLTNYTSMISQFKSHGDDFFTNVPLPPDFATMWTQALQQGFKPKLATVAKVLLFPTDAYAMGSKVYNIATDAWWVPELPVDLVADRADLRRARHRLHRARASASRTRTSRTTRSSRSPTPRSARSTTRTTRRSSPRRCSRSSCPRRSPARSTTPPPTPRPTPPPASRSPRRSASSGRRAPSTRSSTRSSTTPCSRTRRSPATCCPPSRKRPPYRRP